MALSVSDLDTRCCRRKGSTVESRSWSASISQSGCWPQKRHRTMKRSIFAIIAGLLLAAGISTVALAQWPTTCVEANDAFERYVGNEHNVGIYQRTFGDGPEAEQACQNDHREDIRAAFNWAIPESTPATAPTPVEPPPPPAKDYGNWRYTNRDGTHWAWISSSSLNAALEVRCGETTRRFLFLK